MRPEVVVSVRDPELAERLTGAARAVLESLADPEGPAAVKVTGPGEVAGFPSGALAIVPVTARGLRGLTRLVARLEAAGAAGIQLVWNGVEPPRGDVEPVVFAILERGRGAGGGASRVEAPGRPRSGKGIQVFLAADERPLRLLRLPLSRA